MRKREYEENKILCRISRMKSTTSLAKIACPCFRLSTANIHFIFLLKFYLAPMSLALIFIQLNYLLRITLTFSNHLTFVEIQTMTNI